ncbi:hypothetical protein NSQ62_08105 [Solibacillus sp. FSL H8-0523]|uniref:hypothetical protein n=1 Tax=Solibacillus sp. FSL H8-0523 TaxID=2954511 RepID=UPI0031012B92
MKQVNKTSELPFSHLGGYFKGLIYEALTRSNITLKDLAEFIDVENIALKIDYHPAPRECTQCGNGMAEGYCFPEVFEYFCSDECLRENGVSEKEMEEYYNDDVGYWTEWVHEELDREQQYDFKEIVVLDATTRSFNFLKYPEDDEMVLKFINAQLHESEAISHIETEKIVYQTITKVIVKKVESETA